MTFPDFVVGTWGGHLKVLSRRIDKADLAELRIDVGELGTVIFRFIRVGDNVQVIPTAIFFKRRPTDLQHHMLRRSGDIERADDLKRKV